MTRLMDIVTAILILLAMTLSGVDIGKTDPLVPADTTEQTNTATTTEVRVYPELSDTDFNGYNFNILNVKSGSDKKWSQRDIGAEEPNGNLINDAVYIRNRTIEERYNCKINSLQVEYSEAVSLLKRNIMAGDTAYDFATLPLNQVHPLALQGMLVEYGDLPHIDTSKPWWDSSSADSLSVDGKLYGACSDLTIMDKNAAAVLVFNKQLIVDFRMENPYVLVRNGKWTIDKLEEMARNVTLDLDGNGKLDDNDRFGLLYQRDSINSFLAGCGGMITVKDENDLPAMSLTSPINLIKTDKIFDLLYNDGNNLHATKHFSAKEEIPSEGALRMYQSYQTLFMWVHMAEVENLRRMEPEFGILPMPKYDREQVRYQTAVNANYSSVVIVPKSVQSYDKVGFIIEALSAESRSVLLPAYYDVLLRAKYYRDEESADMLDVIFSKRVYDLGDIYNFGNVSDQLKDMTMSFNRNIEEMYKNSGKNVDSALKKTIHLYQDID